MDTAIRLKAGIARLARKRAAAGFFICGLLSFGLCDAQMLLREALLQQDGAETTGQVMRLEHKSNGDWVVRFSFVELGESVDAPPRLSGDGISLFFTRGSGEMDDVWLAEENIEQARDRSLVNIRYVRMAPWINRPVASGKIVSPALELAVAFVLALVTLTWLK